MIGTRIVMACMNEHTWKQDVVMHDPNNRDCIEYCPTCGTHCVAYRAVKIVQCFVEHANVEGGA